MTIDLFDLIIIFLAGFGILICLGVGIQLLFRKSGIKLTNYLLGLLLILYGLTTFNSLMSITGVWSQNPHLYFLPIMFNLSIGPLFYFFVRSKIQPSFSFKRNHSVHFVLPVIQFLFYLSIGFRSASYKGMIWRDVVAPYVQYIEEGLLIVLGIGYLVAVLNLLKKKIPQELWKKPVYIWLKKFTISFLILLTIHSSYEMIDWVFTGLLDYNIYNSSWAVILLKLVDVAISFVIGFNAYLYQHQTLIIPQQSEAQNDVFENRIESAFVYEKIYLNPELTLETFSKVIGYHKNKISKLLSERGDTFRGVVNRHRVEEFTRLMDDEKLKHLSMLGLAYESGFNSKASFNRAFKELKGVSPSEYLKPK